MSDRLAGLGSFFAVRTHAPDAAPSQPWRPMLELVQSTTVLVERVRRVRAALAESAGRPVEEIESRVAASVTHLGLVARLIAPVFAAAVIDGDGSLDLSLVGPWWQDHLGGPYPLSLAVQPRFGSADLARRDLFAVLLGDHIEPITDAVAAAAVVSPRVLWGNVASAINGAAVMIGTREPTLAGRGRELATAVLSDSRFDTEPGAPGPSFRRTSCCLIYRIASGEPAGVCGDCVLTDLRAPST